MINPSTHLMKLRTNPLRINIAFVRGAYLNNFEGQNYNIPGLTGFGSLHSIHSELPFPVIRLPSLSDYNLIGRWGRAIANRTLGDIQNLFGLENYALQFDIFHTADPHYYYSFQLARLRAENKIKHLLVTSWETIPFNNETIEIKKRNKYFVLKNADHFLCYTQRAKECLILEGVEERKITVIRLGVDLDKFKLQNSKLKSNSNHKDQIQITFIGRLVEEKGVMDAYEAFKIAKRVTQNVKRLSLKLVGEGPLKHILQQKIRRDKLYRFVTIVQKRYQDMSSVYRQADIFILPSLRTKTWEEQYGMVLVEAMASGLPIIAYDTGAIGEIIEDCGLRIKEGDVAKLAGSLGKLITDEKERVKLGTMGRERAEKFFDCKKTAESIGELYKKLSGR